jgi:Ulp1 family protease
MVFWPVHLPGHWVALVLYPEVKRILYFDSYLNVNTGKMLRRKLLVYLQEEAKGMGLPFDPTEWDITSSCLNPQQQINNYSNCGMYVCMIGDFLAEQLPLNAMSGGHMILSDHHMIKLRIKVFTDICRGYIQNW